MLFIRFYLRAMGLPAATSQYYQSNATRGNSWYLVMRYSCVGCPHPHQLRGIRTHHDDLHTGVLCCFVFLLTLPCPSLIACSCNSACPPQLHLLHHGRQTSRGLPFIGGARARASPAGNVTCREGHQLPGQVHPGAVWWEPRVHAQQRTARPAGPRLQQVGGGLLWRAPGSLWRPRKHLWAVQGTESTNLCWWWMSDGL